MENCFAVTAPGLAALAAAELRALGIHPSPESVGVAFTGDREAIYKANLHLRTASRVIVRLGTPFFAAAFPELRKKAARLPWDHFIKPGQPVALHVTCHKSRLYHSSAVAERVAGAIADRLGKVSPAVKGSDASEEDNPAQLVIVRLQNDQVTISVDTSGALLHRRGWRLATAKAPLRETLAAAMLIASGWDTAFPLIDPFCGSGTIAIEAALMAQGRPPGCMRRFAFENWPGFDAARWKSLKSACSVPEKPVPPILASDRDAGAVEIARANAERAGVADRIAFSRSAVSAIEPPQGPGWVVTNPPYGLRVSEGKDLRSLYAQLGNVLRARCPSWHVAVLSSDLILLGQIGLKLDTSLSMVNGGVGVRLGVGQVPAEEQATDLSSP